jgi:hypothetical protein
MWVIRQYAPNMQGGCFHYAPAGDNLDVLAWCELSKPVLNDGEDEAEKSQFLIDKKLLINAIKGKGFSSMRQADKYVRMGLAVFTGNQRNGSWEWIDSALMNIDDKTLLGIYQS